MNLLWGDGIREPELNEAISGFVSALTGYPPFKDYTSLGVFLHGRIIAGVVFSEHFRDRGTIDLSGAAIDKRWLTRPVMTAIFRYVFGQLGCQLAINRVSERDRTQRRQLLAVGYTEHFIPRLRGRDEGEFVYTLTDEAWRAGRFHEVNDEQP